MCIPYKLSSFSLSFDDLTETTLQEEEKHEFYHDGFHERLATHWPEPRQQLHSGGWDQTKNLVHELGIDDGKKRVLDMCCGEGGTAVYISEAHGNNVVGIDLVKKAISVAEALAKEKGVSEKCTFVRADCRKMPFEDDSFDVVIAQDPDGFSEPFRIEMFKEANRVLKHGCTFAFHHHWIAGPGFDDATLDKLGDKGTRCSADYYKEDLETAGFKITKMDEMAEMAEAHLRGMVASMVKGGVDVEKNNGWLFQRIKTIEDGHKFGVIFRAQK